MVHYVNCCIAVLPSNGYRHLDYTVIIVSITTILIIIITKLT